MSERILIKNWAKFQHFKDRRPPWVKLYRELLDDREWHKLDGESAKMLVSLWLLGSEDSGVLPDSEEIAFRLRLDENKVKKCLKNLSHWLISERYQDDINTSQKNSVADIEVPLRDRDRDRDREETEREKETEAPEGVSISVWVDFKKLRKSQRAPITETALDGIRREASKAGLSLEGALIVCVERSWRSFRASWLQKEKTTGAGEPQWRTEQRKRTLEAVPSIAEGVGSNAIEFFDVEAKNVTAITLG